MSNKIFSVIINVLLISFIIVLAIELRYEPNDVPSQKMLGPYDFFLVSPQLPLFSVALFVFLAVYLAITKHFLVVNLTIAMILILIFAVNSPNLVHHNVFSHNIATVEMLREGHVDQVTQAQANLWPGFFFTAGFLMEVTGLDIVTLNTLMLSLFVFFMAIAAYCFGRLVYEVTRNRLAMFIPLLMWIFLFNNRVLYEFMFHHQWYAATLMPLVFYILLKLDSSFGDTTGRRAYLLSILIISSAITIIHPITGFMTSLALILYALVRRRALGTAVASLCIYLGWWAFVTMSYIGNAWAFVQAFLGGNLVAGFVARSFTAQPALPFYDSIARNVYKAYYLLALALSLIIVVAVLTKKIKSINRVVVGIVLTSGCALVSVLVFFPFGLGSVLWEDRVYWHIPIPLAIACTLSLIVLSSAFSKYVPRKLRKLKIEYFVFFVVFSGLICSSLLLFAMNFYTLYYSPSSDRQLSIWAVAHSENGSKFAVGNTFRPPAYYAILYGKNIDASRSYPATWKSLDDLLRPLKEANLTIYTAHLESSWQTGMNNLGYSIDNETARNAIRSILDQQNIIFSDGKNIVYQFP